MCAFLPRVGNHTQEIPVIQRMRGKKSYAQLRRDAMGLENPKSVDPAISLQKRKAAIRSVVARGNAPPEAEGALIRAAELAAVKQQREDKKQQEKLGHQIDGAVRGRQILRAVAPALTERLARIALGNEPDFAPREQLGAMRLVAEISGLVDGAGGHGGADVPLNQQSVGMLRACIAAGEARIAELQAHLDDMALEGEAVQAD